MARPTPRTPVRRSFRLDAPRWPSQQFARWPDVVTSFHGPRRKSPSVQQLNNTNHKRELTMKRNRSSIRPIHRTETRPLLKGNSHANGVTLNGHNGVAEDPASTKRVLLDDQTIVR